MKTFKKIHNALFTLMLAVLAVALLLVGATLVVMFLDYLCDHYQNFIAGGMVLALVGFAWWLIHDILYGGCDADHTNK